MSNEPIILSEDSMDALCSLLSGATGGQPVEVDVDRKGLLALARYAKQARLGSWYRDAAKGMSNGETTTLALHFEEIAGFFGDKMAGCCLYTAFGGGAFGVYFPISGVEVTDPDLGTVLIAGSVQGTYAGDPGPVVKFQTEAE